MKTKSNPSILKCHVCGSNLILTEVMTHTIGNNFSPITRNTYRCSNSACQKDTDEKTAKRIKLKREQEEAQAIRKQEALAKTLESKKL